MLAHDMSVDAQDPSLSLPFSSFFAGNFLLGLLATCGFPSNYIVFPTTWSASPAHGFVPICASRIYQPEALIGIFFVALLRRVDERASLHGRMSETSNGILMLLLRFSVARMKAMSFENGELVSPAFLCCPVIEVPCDWYCPD